MSAWNNVSVPWVCECHVVALNTSKLRVMVATGSDCAPLAAATAATNEAKLRTPPLISYVGASFVFLAKYFVLELHWATTDLESKQKLFNICVLTFSL